MADGEPTTKRFKHSIISEHMFEAEFQDIFLKHWHDRTPYKNSKVEIIAQPFRVCKISNFLANEEFMDELKNELIDVKTRRNCIDLYQFEQSEDLSTAQSPNIKTLYNTFQTNLSEWMARNTKITLNQTMSMTSSCYSDTDYLLCHDDNLGDRRIAFILYLSENWTEEDGGALDLFDTDENGLPSNVVKSIVPEYNSLVFFEVVKNSFHQVAEVTSPDKSRWSINGWFHGPVLPIDKPVRPEPVIERIAPENTEVDLSRWISNNYLYPGIMKEIQEDVEQESFTFLSNFLKEDVYESLSEAIESPTIRWKRVGPANVRNYEVADEDTLSGILADFCNIFKSITVFQLLKNYTELDLIPETDDMEPRVTIELQRWSNGCYTLIQEYQPTEEEEEEMAAVSNYKKPPPEPTPECSTKLARDPSIEEYEASGEKNAGEGACGENTPPSSQGEDEESEACPRPAADKSPPKRERRITDTEDDSEVSDIGDYLSDPLDGSYDNSEEERERKAAEARGEEIVEVPEPGSLDVLMQFHTSRLDRESIDYVDPREEDAALIHVPSNDNHLCLVYKTIGTCRLHRYINHYVKGYFYNLICTYVE